MSSCDKLPIIERHFLNIDCTHIHNHPAFIGPNLCRFEIMGVKRVYVSYIFPYTQDEYMRKIFMWFVLQTLDRCLTNMSTKRLRTINEKKLWNHSENEYDHIRSVHVENGQRTNYIIIIKLDYLLSTDDSIEYYSKFKF